jgi:nickel transport protein
MRHVDKYFRSIVIGLFLVAVPLLGHDIHSKIVFEKAAIVKLDYGDGIPYSEEKCEIYSMSESVDKPYQILYTDKNGTLAFVPNQKGKYALKCFSEDGHGVSLEIEVDPSQLLASTVNNDSQNYHYAKVALGLLIILVLFLGIKVYMNRSSKES